MNNSDLAAAITNKRAVVLQAIALYEKIYHRAANSIQLIAVSKNQSIAKLEAAYSAGQRDFAENYVQEAAAKLPLLTHLNINWHFIGSIQSNKTRFVAENFDWVHSIDKLKIAERLNAQRPAHLPPLNVFLAVNIDDEQQKTGCDPNAVLSLLANCRDLPRLNVRGLMCIPKPAVGLINQRQPFYALATLQNQLNHEGYHLDSLSMGMTNDFEAAIAEGATHVRIGTGIFGLR